MSGANSSGFRQLPCKTFISVGTCPFRERCDYLHDPRLFSKNIKSKTRKRNFEDNVEDKFYWPPCSVEIVRRRLDNYGQPFVVQMYDVPKPKLDEHFRHSLALLSMWSYFVEFCMTNDSQFTKETVTSPQYLYQESYYPFDENPIKRRSPAFDEQFRSDMYHGVVSNINMTGHPNSTISYNYHTSGVTNPYMFAPIKDEVSDINKFTGRRRLRTFIELAKLRIST